MAVGSHLAREWRLASLPPLLPLPQLQLLLLLLLQLIAGAVEMVSATTELVSQLGVVVHGVTSKPDTVGNAIDGDPGTFWQSGACQPSGWISRPEVNLLLGACAQGLCASSEDYDVDLSPITDGNMAYTTVWFNPLQSISATWLRLIVPRGPKRLRYLRLRGRFYSNTTVTAISANKSEELIGVMTPQDQYVEKVLLFPEGFVTAELELRSTSEVRKEMGGWCYGGVGDCIKFMVHDIAASADDCFEGITLDFHQIVHIESVWARLSGQSGITNISL